eukprot:5417599-Pleurochrysis_carterae.AAC.1
MVRRPLQLAGVDHPVGLGLREVRLERLGRDVDGVLAAKVPDQIERLSKTLRNYTTRIAVPVAERATQLSAQTTD